MSLLTWYSLFSSEFMPILLLLALWVSNEAVYEAKHNQKSSQTLMKLALLYSPLCGGLSSSCKKRKAQKYWDEGFVAHFGIITAKLVL